MAKHLLSAALALICSINAVQLHADESATTEERREEKAVMIYALRPIKAKTKLSSDMFRKEIVPSAKLPQAAAVCLDDLVGRIAQVDIPKDAVIFTHFASGLYNPKGDPDYKDPIPCIYDTSTNSWSIKRTPRKNSLKKARKKNRLERSRK